MVRIDVEIEDYLDEVGTKYLVNELAKRHDLKDYKKELMLEYEMPEFKKPDDVLKFIKEILHLRPWHDKDRIISEIKNL